MLTRSKILIGLTGLSMLGLIIFVFGKSDDEFSSAQGAPMVSVNVPELTGEVLEGKAFFDAKCSVCHGENGAGKQGLAPPLVHKIYEPSHHGDFSFYRAVSAGVRMHHWSFGDMPPIPDVNEAQTEKIIAYIRTLQRANGIN